MRNVCVSVESSGVLIASTYDQLYKCTNSVRVSCGADDDVCRCIVAMDVLGCYDSHCPRTRDLAIADVVQFCGAAEASARASRASAASAAAATSTPAAIRRARFEPRITARGPITA